MILVGGENLIDMIQTGVQTRNVLFEANPGGSSYNLALAVGRQGEKVGYITPISSDANGDLLAEKLRSSNVELLGGRVSAQTSLAVVTVSNGSPKYAFYREQTADRLISIEALNAHLNRYVSIFL